jgi:hypothetical protein
MGESRSVGVGKRFATHDGVMTAQLMPGSSVTSILFVTG